MAAQAAENFSTQAVNSREPSMEEILASIRRIIEDSDGKPELPYELAANTAGSPHHPANTQSTRRSEAAALEAEGLVAEPPRVVQPQQPVRQVERQQAPMPKVEQMAPASAQVLPAEAAKSSILSDIAGRQVAAAFGELSEAFAATRRRSFDEIAEEMMRPMLQEWLDDNLPTLVERLVREEIERIARVGSR